MSHLMVGKNRLWTYIRLTWEMARLSILSAMEYRANFLMQIGGMVLNDFGLIVLWIIFFHQFPTLNGWQFRDTAILFATSTVAYSFLMIFAGGIEKMARLIMYGKLDYYLALPKNPLWHIAVSGTMISALGDFIFGLGIFIAAGGLTFVSTLVFLLVSVLAAWIMFNFVVMAQSLSFFFGNFEESADRFFFVLLSFTHYPQNVFSGALKLFTLTLFPVFFISALPVSLVKSFNATYLLYIFVFALVTFFIAIGVFKLGLKSYESGNLTDVRL